MTISDYFPLTSVLNNATELLGHLFGLRFEHVFKEENWDTRDIDMAPQTHIWQECVQHFVVWDNGEQGKFLGHLYLDLFSRPGKSDGPSHHNIVPVGRSPRSLYRCMRMLTRLLGLHQRSWPSLTPSFRHTIRLLSSCQWKPLYTWLLPGGVPVP